MNKVFKHFGIAVVLTSIPGNRVLAQVNQEARTNVTIDNKLSEINITSTQLRNVNTAPPELIFSPRFGASYSTSGAGYDAFTALEGFVPLFQSGGDLGFIQGKLLNDDSYLSSSVAVGYRRYSEEMKRVIGGYIGYNTRDTGNNSFQQLGVGFESLGDWDFRANAYLPLGSSRKQFSQNTLDIGASSSNFGFFDNYLGVETTKAQQITRRFEAAASGLDAEVGMKFAQIGNNGSIRGYLGGYYYNIPETDNVLGWKARVEAHPNDNLNFGVSLQNDDTFGTNLAFTVGARLSSLPSRKRSNASQSQQRLADSIETRANIPVIGQLESELIYTKTRTVATNPETGQPYIFQHVNLNGASGNGKEENSFSTVQSGIAATQSDGNHIVYVQGTNQTIPPFTIPDRVQVLSTGPVQQLLTNEYGLVTLPRSGSGNFPQVTDTVKLGSNTVLSGFDIAGVTGASVEAKNISNALIRDNIMTASSVAGANLENTSGLITFQNNLIIGDGVPALIGKSVSNLNIVDTDLFSNNSTTNGMLLEEVKGTVEFSNSSIAIVNPAENGIYIDKVSGNLNLNFTTGEISNTGSNGIYVNNSTGLIEISNFEVSNTGEAGILGTSINNLSVINNQINSAQNQGILLESSNGTFNIASNTIVNTQSFDPAPGILPPEGQGISLEQVTGTVNINKNIITDTKGASGVIPILIDSGQGIVLENETGNVNLNISDNQIANNYQNGILIGLGSNTQQNATANISITNNTIENNGFQPNGLPVNGRGEGIGIGIENDAVINNLNVSGNTIRNSGHDAIDIRLGLLPSNTSTAQLNNANISGNIIENNRDTGIQLQTFDNTIANLTIKDNQIQNNGLQSILLYSLMNGKIVANIEGNTLTSNNTARFQAIALPLPATLPTSDRPIMCLKLSNNTSNTGYDLLSLFPAPVSNFNVVNLPNIATNNTGNFSTSGARNINGSLVVFPTGVKNIADLSQCP